MTSAMARFVACLLVGPVLLWGAERSSMHAHESDSGHAHTVVHSHLETHHHRHPTDPSEIEPDEHVVWLTAAAVHGLPFQLDTPAPALVSIADGIVAPMSWSVIPFDTGAPPHGPPRTIASLRAPPSFLSSLT